MPALFRSSSGRRFFHRANHQCSNNGPRHGSRHTTDGCLGPTARCKHLRLANRLRGQWAVFHCCLARGSRRFFRQSTAAHAKIDIGRITLQISVAVIGANVNVAVCHDGVTITFESERSDPLNVLRAFVFPGAGVGVEFASLPTRPEYSSRRVCCCELKSHPTCSNRLVRLQRLLLRTGCNLRRQPVRPERAGLAYQEINRRIAATRGTACRRSRHGVDRWARNVLLVASLGKPPKRSMRQIRQRKKRCRCYISISSRDTPLPSHLVRVESVALAVFDASFDTTLTLSI